MRTVPAARFNKDGIGVSIGIFKTANFKKCSAIFKRTRGDDALMNIGAAATPKIFIAAAIFFQVSPGFRVINIRFNYANDVYFPGSLYPDLTVAVDNLFAG
ncbi:hypothetical protein [Pantoea sp.]|uniref:hypothetical protein n=1 Tax=Pantoea sp. TaxID=69393 RepID=UPI00289D6855|nr:hypothetical protein [Pantoea sp.]